MKKVGISGIGMCLPIRRILVNETIKNWGNTSAKLIVDKFGVRKRTVLNSDEDVITLSVEAAKQCLVNTKTNIKNIDAMFLGTVTSSELYRGSSNTVMEMLTDNNQYFSTDVAMAERSGTVALIQGFANVKAGLCKSVLSIGADALCRYTAPGDLRESYTGAGAACALVDSNNIVAEIEGVTNFNTNFPEIGRPEDERFIRELMPMDSGVQKISIIDHVKTAVQLYLNKYNCALSDFDFVLLPQQYPGQTFQLAKIFGIPNEKIEDAIFSSETGDTGSAAPLIALEKVLESAQPNKRILLCSYGHNAGVDVIGLKTTNLIKDYQKRVKQTVTKILNNQFDVGYAEAMRLEYKFVEPNVSIGTFN
ncbi:MULTISPECIES: hypothetical protein [Latilactobacillus]|uniref:hypothetical protein n=1 Tax=Latilactobacillus TaxID=2767885 RepID=UPI00202EC95B|nr:MULTISPECIES: hypothetical protein [Latilactobacillus]MCM1635766.1 hypothetical protein [Latilactobacillus sakei]MCW8780386.1 hypothetical protein [Latilactobacillus curvatus]